jgi:hypothetical protein
VTDPRSGIASVAITDDSGLFIVPVTNLPGLELAIPNGGIAGVPIAPGDILTILVP